MTSNSSLLLVLCLALLSCTSDKNSSTATPTYADVKVAGSMKNVMWKGQLQASIELDTIQPKKGLYALGPLSYLRGELLINDGKSYVSKVLTDSTMLVEESSDLSAPFLVYANVVEWKKVALSDGINNIETLEAFIDKQTKNQKRPFVFKLEGWVKTADIHIQNLAEGSTVSSPKEAHQGQVGYHLANKEVELIGFFSTEHKGIFTHHDTNVHLHLMSKDKQYMGHLDGIDFDYTQMQLYLPVL